jgi:hypothetical protein
MNNERIPKKKSDCKNGNYKEKKTWKRQSDEVKADLKTLGMINWHTVASKSRE